MQDGKYVVYVVQGRATRKSPWSKPDKPLKPVKDEEWYFASFDHFGVHWEPHIGTGNDWRPKTVRSHDQLHEVQRITGHSGYFTLSYGIRALKRLRKADDEGKFDSRGTYGSHEQAVRHEFRLVKMTISQKTEPVDLAEVVEAL